MKKIRCLSLLICLALAITANAGTQLTVNNLTESNKMGLNYRYIFAFEQIKRVDAKNNYSAILTPVPFLAKYSLIDIIITYDGFMFHRQQCSFTGELSARGLNLIILEAGAAYYHCDIDGNNTRQVIINVNKS